MTRLHSAGRVRAALAATALLFAACSSDPPTDDNADMRTHESPASNPTSPSAQAEDPTYTYTSGPGEVFQLPKDSDFGTVRAGRYEAWRIGSPAHYEVDVPDGWRVLAGTYLNAPTDGHGIFFVASLPKHRTDLAVHPCRDHHLWRVGPTVRDFVRAMQEQPVWKVSTPRPVTLDGNNGLYFEIELPASVDPADCVDGAVSEYESGRDGMATTQSYRGRWWILEVDGQRLVVMARCYDTCTEDDLDTMTAMAESITFSPDRAAGQTGAIPSSVYAVPEQGGLPLEHDLAIGRASVAIANPTGAFAISAADGVYHRLALPGYDARLYSHQRPGLALSPDGWTLAYAWHGPTRVLVPGSRYDGLIPANIRLVDLHTGRISPTEPHVPGLRSQLAWLAWNPRWSPDSRFVVSDLTLVSGDDKGIPTDWNAHNHESDSSVLRLDSSKERVWSSTGRWDDTGIDAPYGSVPIVSPSGGGATVDDGQLHTWRPDGERRAVADGYGAWSTGRFSADGRWLLLQPRGLGDSLLALNATASTPIELPLLDAGEWPDGAAIDLLGWVDADHALATLHRGTGAGTAASDADLVLITLNLADASSDVTVVGKISDGRSENLFSFATDLATAESPTSELAPPPFRQGAEPFQPTDEASP